MQRGVFCVHKHGFLMPGHICIPRILPMNIYVYIISKSKPRGYTYKDPCDYNHKDPLIIVGYTKYATTAVGKIASFSRLLLINLRPQFF